MHIWCMMDVYNITRLAVLVCTAVYSMNSMGTVLILCKEYELNGNSINSM